MTMIPRQSLSSKFRKRDDRGFPVAEFLSKSELSNFLIMLGKREATYEVKERKKTKTKSASWLVTLASPLEALDN